MNAPGNSPASGRLYVIVTCIKVLMVDCKWYSCGRHGVISCWNWQYNEVIYCMGGLTIAVLIMLRGLLLRVLCCYCYCCCVTRPRLMEICWALLSSHRAIYVEIWAFNASKPIIRAAWFAKNAIFDVIYISSTRSPHLCHVILPSKFAINFHTS